MARTYESAARRWEGIGPYYAMFPTAFADEVVERHTSPGDSVLDPFAGRGTAVFSAAQLGRKGVGVEINPVGWIYGRTKLEPAQKSSVARRLIEMADCAGAYGEEASALPTFFHYCFCEEVRKFLLAARARLNWRERRVDRTVMALMLVHLHGKRGTALSNQMRQAKSMAPDYAIRWWEERSLEPPVLDPLSFMLRRLEWRYAKGVPNSRGSAMSLGDSEDRLSNTQWLGRTGVGRFRLLLTSPPYYALTNYHYDQWLRLWLLGGPATARRVPGSHELRGKFESRVRYRRLLENVFGAAADLLASDATVYVRTGADNITYETTREVLGNTFSKYKVLETPRPYSAPTQTSLFGDRGKKAGEVDIVLSGV